MILEVAILDIRPKMVDAFEAAFYEAQTIIAGIPGYISHELQKCIEVENRYLLLVQWETLDAHTVGFRGSEAYGQWRKLLHHFYDPFPIVEHYRLIVRNQ